MTAGRSAAEGSAPGVVPVAGPADAGGSAGGAVAHALRADAGVRRAGASRPQEVPSSGIPGAETPDLRPAGRKTADGPSGGTGRRFRAVSPKDEAAGLAYLMPVVAMPLMRNRWPKRNTRKTGSSDTMDIANSDPQLVADCESTKARRATGTVNISGSVR